MSLHPKVIDLTLDRMARLLPLLGDPQLQLPPVIHVAGTNGKGSTQAMIRAGIEAAGQTRPRLYLAASGAVPRTHPASPAQIIPEPDLAALLDECEAANGGAPITFFEITTCAAFLAFARVPADCTLLEVGLGGRWDATNVIDAAAAVGHHPGVAGPSAVSRRDGGRDRDVEGRDHQARRALRGRAADRPRGWR